MSMFLDNLKIGEMVKIKGPAGPVLYYGQGRFNIHGYNINVNQVSMVAGGTGITPMYQLAKAIVQDPEDKTLIKLVYSNHTVEDILLRKELDELIKSSNGQFEVWHTLSTPPKKEWKFGVGRISEHMFSQHLFPPGEHATIALACGPPMMVEGASFPDLEKLGYPADTIFEF